MQSAIAQRLEAVLGPSHRRGATLRALSVEGVSKRYGETQALNDVSIEFEPGTIHTILGENGSGKSTLLKLLSGIVQPTAGRIMLNGNEIRPRSPLDMQSLGLDTVFQEVLITPYRSVSDNVLLGYDGLFKRRIPERLRDATAKAALDALSTSPIDLDELAGEVPLAMQQLIVIARALSKLPSILLLDEATAALDYGDRDRVFDVVTDYARAGNLVIFISHRMDEVKRLSDRVSVLRSGRLVDTLQRAEVTSERLLKLMAPEAVLHA